MTASRPAFYALAPGGWRDYVTLLHPPYTLWHLSYAAIGAALAPHLDVDRLVVVLVAFFLAVWEEGLKLRDAHRDEIVALYPEHFAVEDDADIEFLTEFLNEQDPVVESPYLDEEWIENEVKVFDLLEETGFAGEEITEPTFEVFSPEMVREQAPDSWNPPA